MTQLFDISTTVDPSYVISLIRKLLPPTMNATTTDSTTRCDVATQGTNDVATNGSKCDSSSDREKDVESSVGDDSWEEHGCVLWDLATSRTHAELMVLDCSVTQFRLVINFLLVY